MLQLFRLESAQRLGAEALASGDVRAIGPYLAVLDRLDRYRRGRAPSGLRRKTARDRLFAKLNRVANRLLAKSEPKPPAEGGPEPALDASETGSNGAIPLDSPASH